MCPDICCMTLHSLRFLDLLINPVCSSTYWQVSNTIHKKSKNCKQLNVHVFTYCTNSVPVTYRCDFGCELGDKLYKTQQNLCVAKVWRSVRDWKLRALHDSLPCIISALYHCPKWSISFEYHTIWRKTQIKCTPCSIHWNMSCWAFYVAK